MALDLARVRLVILDVDGVLTDGRLYFGPEGEALKVFHVRDGHGLKLLRAAGIRLAVISGRSSAAVSARCAELGIEFVEQGCGDKREALARILQALNINTAETLCIVDDTTDLPLMMSVGYAVAVADAHPEVRAAAARVTQLPGGRGAVREVCDWLLAARDEDPR
jgi:3-deoxy-D-manno-octulosonate 8-phosphate phosphatase (KDO 8-P phosphatase)